MEQLKNTTISSKCYVPSFGASKPVAPVVPSARRDYRRPLDPSSFLRSGKYPVPASFDVRSR
ncbi:MAG TPA: hypothetical protein VEZ55_06295 [Chitinophagaceae bacterium]|nr:hypothetical protein [Chitinophagaceae bacterium]